MKVEYFHEIPGVGYGNIMWPGAFPMRGGRFPAGHPCAAGMRGGIDVQFGTSAALTEFRGRGYWASCFPEGDGITMKVGNGQSPEQVAKDIAECFGWEVVIKRGVTANG